MRLTAKASTEAETGHTKEKANTTSTKSGITTFRRNRHQLFLNMIFIY